MSTREINKVIRALGGEPKTVKIVSNSLPQADVVARLSKEHHAHTFLDTVDVGGLEVSVFDVPTLRRKFVVFTAASGAAFTGYIPNEVYGKAPEPKADTASEMLALVHELASRGVIRDHDDLSQDEADLVNALAVERGIIKQTKTKSREVVRAAESRKPAKALGGKALKGTARQKAWAEEIRKAALQRCSTEQAEVYLTDSAYAHAEWWIENRERFGFKVSRYARIQNEIWRS